jgi:hypothetical protein
LLVSLLLPVLLSVPPPLSNGVAAAFDDGLCLPLVPAAELAATTRITVTTSSESSASNLMRGPLTISPLPWREPDALSRSAPEPDRGVK